MSKLSGMSTLTYAMPRAEARPTSLRAAFAVLVLAMLPAVLDQTVLATALPTIAAQLGSIGDISHLVTVYVLASTGTAAARCSAARCPCSCSPPPPAVSRRPSSSSWSRAASRGSRPAG